MHLMQLRTLETYVLVQQILDMQFLFISLIIAASSGLLLKGLKLAGDRILLKVVCLLKTIIHVSHKHL